MGPRPNYPAAARALVVTYRVIIELLIWVFMVLVPILAPPILVIWLIVWLYDGVIENRPQNDKQKTAKYSTFSRSSTPILDLQPPQGE